MFAHVHDARYRLFYDGASLNPLLLAALHKMPAHDPKAEAWTSLFLLYGTHYVSSIGMGSECEFTLRYNQGAMSKFSAGFQKTQFGLRIEKNMKQIGIGGDWGWKKAWGANSSSSFQRRMRHNTRALTATRLYYTHPRTRPGRSSSPWLTRTGC